MAFFSYVAFFAFAALFTAACIAYFWKFREKSDDTHGMMAGMIFGTLAGLVPGALIAYYNGDFLAANIAGVAIGVAIGLPLGRAWCVHGRLEGVAGGVMGGLMGAMLGQMIRIYPAEQFFPFLAAITIVVGAEAAYATHKKYAEGKITEYVVVAGIFAIALLASSFLLDFSQEDSAISTGAASAAVPAAGQQALGAKKYPWDSLNSGPVEAKISGNLQEVDLRISAYGYSPSTIVAKQGVPLKINLKADSNAGCARDIVFSDFGVRKLVARGGSETVQLDTSKAGEFVFRCSMDMFRGKLVIKQ